MAGLASNCKSQWFWLFLPLSLWQFRVFHYKYIKARIWAICPINKLCMLCLPIKDQNSAVIFTTGNSGKSSELRFLGQYWVENTVFKLLHLHKLVACLWANEHVTSSHRYFFPQSIYLTHFESCLIPNNIFKNVRKALNCFVCVKPTSSFFIVK